jgi:4-hydroxythreonine-4-phosphate dehydrogenase
LSVIKRIALTPGEPSGIGPDLILALAQQKHEAQLVALADPELLRQRAKLLGIPINLLEIDLSMPRQLAEAGELYVYRISSKRL